MFQSLIGRLKTDARVADALHVSVVFQSLIGRLKTIATSTCSFVNF